MFLKKYKFPINIFICFEKINCITYTSENLTKNHYVCFIPQNWSYGLNLFLRNEIFFNFISLIDISIIDTIKYNSIIPEKEFYNFNNRFILYNIYYCYFIKLRLTFIQSINHKAQSVESIFRNAWWLEREASEMYGIFFLNKKDNRSLLLDYSRNEFPMLKDFPTEGFYEIYYDFFENKLNYVKNEFIEL